ncbi:MAG: NAD(P)/FAD-dependent oxidoreductase [Balneolaceae bacterium]
MIIGIIGAGISGLTAGRLLARAGHEVTIIEKSRGYGGRMATRYADKEKRTKFDHGLPWFQAESPEFQAFVAELIEKNIVKLWGDNFAYYVDGNIFKSSPANENIARFTARNGMNSIGQYLGRWVDVKLNTKAGGLTCIGAGRKKKHTWMINLTSAATFEADAVIIATPAPQAYGILQSTIDETDTLKMVRVLDEVKYDSAFSLLAGYGKRTIPDWDGIVCKNEDIKFISNEASKRDHKQECSLVIHSTSAFAKKHKDADHERVTVELLQKAADIAGAWVSAPEWNQLHFWRYNRTLNPLSGSYLELESPETPLALIGDYFAGNTVDHAYSSGYKLASSWVEKYQNK